MYFFYFIVRFAEQVDTSKIWHYENFPNKVYLKNKQKLSRTLHLIG